MVSNHFPIVYGSGQRWLLVPGFVAAGWAATRALYAKVGTPAPARF